MKNLYLTVFLLSLVSAFAKGQAAQNELKINLLGVITGLPELSYERIIAKRNGLGIAFAKGIGANHAHEFQFLAMPYSRWYFGNKEATGFFVEGNAALAYGKENGTTHEVKEEAVKFGLGLAIGCKMATRRNFLAEINLGAGKYINGSDFIDYPRIGIAVGKRF